MDYINTNILILLLICGIICTPTLLWLRQFFDNKKQIHKVKVIFPNPDDKDEEKYKKFMYGFFSSMHGISLNDRISVEIYKIDKSIHLVITASSIECLNAIKTLLTKLNGIKIIDIGDSDPLNILSQKKINIARLTLSRNYNTINQNQESFFDTLINTLSSVESDQQAGILFLLRGVQVDNEIENLINKRKIRLSKNSQSQAKDSEVEDLEEKKHGNLFMTDIYSITNDFGVEKNIISIFKSLNGKNKFYSQRISSKNIEKLKKRIIKIPDFRIKIMRKSFGSFLNAKEISSMIRPLGIERGSYEVSEGKIIEASPDFLIQGENNILIGTSTQKEGSKTNVYFPIENLDRHIYLIGKTGMGKSTLLMQLFTSLDRLSPTQSLILLDPHGSDLIKIAQRIKNWENLVYFDLGNQSQSKTITYNPLLCYQKTSREKDARVEELLDIFIHEALLKEQGIGPSTELLLRKAIETGVNFADAYFKYLISKGIKEEKAKEFVKENQITINDLEFIFNPNYKYIPLMQEVFKDYDEPIGHFWSLQFPSFQIRNEELIGLRNRINNLIYPSIKTLFEGNKFNIIQLVQEKKRILIPLTIKSFGKVSRRIFAKLLLAELWFDAQFNFDEDKINEATIFIDEFQNVQMPIVEELLSEARKFKKRMVFGNQYFSQIEPKVRNAVMGNVANIFTFNLGNIEEAKLIPPLYKNKISESDIASLPAFTAYMKTLNPEKNKDVALMSYQTLNFEEHSPTLHDVEDLTTLNTQTLDLYGEDKEKLNSKMVAKQKNAVEYFLEIVPV